MGESGRKPIQAISEGGGGGRHILHFKLHFYEGVNL